MKVLTIILTYGNKPRDIIEKNIANAGYPTKYIEVCTYGVANALNEGLAHITNEDAFAFMANDITEPNNWLHKKVEALTTYPNAGIVASSIDYARTEIMNETIISNWLISKKVIDAIGQFNESMFPYGPIDLDYVERTWLAGFNTYFVKNCLASHPGAHATGIEYGFDKAKMVKDMWPKYLEDLKMYKNGTKNVFINVIKPL